MQVRIRTTPGEVSGVAVIAAGVGAFLVLLSVSRAGLTTAPLPAVPSPVVSVQASPAPAAAVVQPARHTGEARPVKPHVVKAPRGSGLRDGGHYILGIYIPPPGDR